MQICPGNSHSVDMRKLIEFTIATGSCVKRHMGNCIILTSISRSTSMAQKGLQRVISHPYPLPLQMSHPPPCLGCKGIRRLQRSMLCTLSNPKFHGTPSQSTALQGKVVPDHSNSRHTAGLDMDTYFLLHCNLPSIEIPGPSNSTLGPQSANQPSHQSLTLPGGPSSAPLGSHSQYGVHGQALSHHVLGQVQLGR